MPERMLEDPARFACGWNFGPAESDAKPVRWIADKLVQLWGDAASWTQDNAAHPHEDHYLKLDVSKARAVLDWHPLLPLDEALEWTVQWYRAFEAKRDLRDVVKTQLERYQDLGKPEAVSNF